MGMLDKVGDGLVKEFLERGFPEEVHLKSSGALRSVAAEAGEEYCDEVDELLGSLELDDEIAVELRALQKSVVKCVEIVFGRGAVKESFGLGIMNRSKRAGKRLGLEGEELKTFSLSRDADRMNYLKFVIEEARKLFGKVISDQYRHNNQNLYWSAPVDVRLKEYRERRASARPTISSH